MKRHLSLLLVCLTMILSACGGSPAGQLSQQPTTQPQGRTQPTSAPTVAAASSATSGAMPYSVAEGTVDSALRYSTGGDKPVNGEPYDATFYENYGVNPAIDTEDDSLSTFAMDVDTASYTVMRRYLGDGYLPDKDSVRTEEYLNYFNDLYSYPQPQPGQDFAITIHAGPTPFGGSDRYELIQVGIQGRTVDIQQRKPAHLTFVVDVSGSMQAENRLSAVVHALTRLTSQLRPDDTVAIAVYGSVGSTVLQPTSGEHKQAILDALNRLVADGSTNAESGLDHGIRLAEQAFQPGHINMVLLCSDGVANNGITDATGLLKKNQAALDQGIQISTFGFGMGNFNDVLMEQLANDGDGSYAYIDDQREAERVFVEQLSGTIQTIARDAKIQVEFNPAVVSRYRLLGYENRDVADQDFRNDQVDAGEVGAGHSVTALYEIKRVPGATGPVATVSIRYQPVDGEQVLETSATLESGQIASDLAGMPGRYRLALSVGQYAELLRQSYWAKEERLADVTPLVAQLRSEYGGRESFDEFSQLLDRAVALSQQ